MSDSGDFSPSILEVEPLSPFHFGNESQSPPMTAPLPGEAGNPITIYDSESEGGSKKPLFVLDSGSDGEGGVGEDSDAETIPPNSQPPTAEGGGDSTESWSSPCEYHPDAWIIRPERYFLSLNEMWSRWDGVYGGGQPIDLDLLFFLFVYPTSSLNTTTCG